MTGTRRPRNRRDQIVTSAARQFAERGFAAVGVDAIGSAIGVTGPALYKHFRGKEALLAEIMQRGASRFSEMPGVLDCPDPRDQLMELVRGTAHVVLSEPEFVVCLSREQRNISKEQRDDVRALERASFRMWTKVLAQAIPGIERWDIVVRERAVLGLLVSVAIGARRGVGAEMEELLIGSTVELVSTPARRPSERALAATYRAPQESRKDQIVRTALELMGRDGYDGVRMDEIGASIGISGSAVYRYFTTKSAILVAAFDQANDMASRTSAVALRNAQSPRDAMRRLVSSYVTVAFANVDLITVTEREWRSLPPEHTSRLRRSARKEREVWVATCSAARPDLDRPRVEMLVSSVQGMVNAAAQTDPRKVNAPAMTVRSGVTHLAWRYLGIADA